MAQLYSLDDSQASDLALVEMLKEKWSPDSADTPQCVLSFESNSKTLIARIFVGVAIFGAITLATTVRASSAVAVAINSKGGVGYGFYHDPEITEAEARRRAINECLNWGGRNARIIASTSKRGYGVVLWFVTADKKLDYTAALAARTWDTAVNQAKKEAKSLGGTGFKIIRGWNDATPDKRRRIIMQKL